MSGFLAGQIKAIIRIVSIFQALHYMPGNMLNATYGLLCWPHGRLITWYALCPFLIGGNNNIEKVRILPKETANH